MYKIIVRFSFFVLAFVGMSLSSLAQNEKLIHYGGPGAIVTQDNSGGGPLGIYNARYVFKDFSESSSLGLATYTGLFFQYGTYVDEFGTQRTGSAFAFSLPVLVEYNLGRHATYEANNRFGLFAGAGLGFDIYQDGDAENGVASSFGPMVSGGFRVKFLRQDYAFRGSYMLGLAGDNVYGVSMLYGLNRNDEIREKRERGRSGGRGYQYRRGNRYKHKWIRKNRQRRYYRHDRTGRRGNSFQY